MTWKPILVGVDATLEAARAAAFGERLAEAAGTRCVLLHVVSTPAPPPAAWSEPRMPAAAIVLPSPERATEMIGTPPASTTPVRSPTAERK